MDLPDERIPVRFGAADEAGPGDALLLEAAGAPLAEAAMRAVARFASERPANARHQPGCVCCLGRTAAATALAALFQNRAIGRVAWFTRVLAVVRDPGAVADELRADRIVAARFRIEG